MKNIFRKKAAYLLLLLFICGPVLAQEDEFSNFVNDFNALKEELENTQASYQKLQGEYNSKVRESEALNSRLLELDKQKFALELQLKDMQGRSQDLDSRGRELSRQLWAKEKSLTELNQQYLQAVSRSGSCEVKLVVLENEKLSLRAELDKLKAQQLGWQSQSKDLNNSIQQLNSALQAKDKTISELKQEQADSGKREAGAQAKSKDYEFKLKHLEQLQAERSALQKELDDLKEDRLGKESHIRELSGSIKQLSAAIQEKDKSIMDLRDAHSALLRQQNESQTRIVQLQAERDSLAVELKKQNGQIVALMAGNDELANSLRQVNSIVQEKEKAIAELRQSQDELLRKHADVSLSLSGYEARAAALESQKDKIITDSGRIRKELIKRHTDDLWQLKGYQDNLSFLQSERTALQNELSGLKTQQFEREAKGKELSSSLRQLNNVIQDKEKIITELRLIQDDSLKQQAENKARLADYENKLVSLEAEKSSLEDALERQKEKEVLLEGQGRQLGSSLKDTERSIYELNQARGQLLKKHSAHIWQINGLEGKIKILEGQKSGLENQLERLRVEGLTLQANNKDLAASVNQLSGSLQEKDKAITALKQAQEELLKKQDNLNIGIKDYQVKISALEDEKARLTANLEAFKSAEASSQGQNKELTGSIGQLSLSIQDKDKRISELEAVRGGLLKRQEEADLKIKDYEANLVKLQQERQELDSQLGKLKSDEMSWQANNKELAGAIQQLTLSVQDKDRIIEELKALQVDLNKKLEEYPLRINDYENKLNQLQEAKALSEAALKDALSREEGLKAQGQQLSVSLQDKERLLAQFKESEKDLRGRQDNSISLIKDYEDKLAYIKGEKTNLQNQLNEFKFREQEYKTKIDDLAGGIQNKEKGLLQGKQKEKELLDKLDDYSAKLRDYENSLRRLENENISLKSREQEAKSKENTWRVTSDELVLVSGEKDRAIQTLKQKQEESLLDIQGYQSNIREMDTALEELKRRNKLLINDNKFLKQKVESYPRKLSQVSVLKERLLKENAVLHYNLGVFHIQRQEYSEAIVEFEKVLELNPNDPATHYNLGIIYADYLNNRTKAILHFKRYLFGAPKDDKDIERAKKYLLTWEKWEAR